MSLYLGKADPQSPRISASENLTVAGSGGAESSAAPEVFVIGKGGPSNGTNLVQSYNPESRRWWVGPPAPTKRKDFGFAVCDGRIFVVGGEGKGFSRAVEVFDPATENWVSGPPMPTARSGLGLAASGGLIYAVGGGIYEGGWKCFGALEVLDPVAGHWRVSPPMPTPRSKLAVVAARFAGSSRVLTIGGFAPGEGHLDTLEVYHLMAQIWEAGPRMPTPRSALGAAMICGRVITIGGWAGTWLDTVEIFDLATWTWEAGLRMPTARSGLSVEVCGGRVLAMGGFNKCILGTVEILDPASWSWESGPPMPSVQRSPARSGHPTRQMVPGPLVDDAKPDLVVTVHAKPQCAVIDESRYQNNEFNLICTNAAGVELVAMQVVAGLERIAKFRGALAKRLAVPQQKLCLALPDGRLITGTDDAMPLSALWFVKGTTISLRSVQSGKSCGSVLQDSCKSGVIGQEEFAAAVSEAEERRLSNEVETLKRQLSEIRVAAEEKIQTLKMEIDCVRSTWAQQKVLLEGDIANLRLELDKAQPAPEAGGRNARRNNKDCSFRGGNCLPQRTFQPPGTAAGVRVESPAGPLAVEENDADDAAGWAGRDDFLEAATCEAVKQGMVEELRDGYAVSMAGAEGLRTNLTVAGSGEEYMKTEIAVAGSGEAPSTERQRLRAEIDTLRAELVRVRAGSPAAVAGAAGRGSGLKISPEAWHTWCFAFGCFKGLWPHRGQ